MDGFQAGKPGGQNADKPIPFNDGLSISHAPLDLGGGTSSSSSESSEDMPMPIIKDTGKKVSWPDRITGVKTFYTKLHGGAIDFLDDIICKWLTDNPGVTIKRTNTVVGDIVAKKTEPSIIITIWY
jgi:DNA-binding Lrp family transcriptional regulator